MCRFLDIFDCLLNHVQKPQLLFSAECREKNPDSTSVLAFIEVICSSGPAGV